VAVVLAIQQDKACLALVVLVVAVGLLIVEYLLLLQALLALLVREMLVLEEHNLVDLVKVVVAVAQVK
jgi:hypothetical protein